MAERTIEYKGDQDRPARGFLAEPDGAGPHPGVVMIPGVNGLGPDLERLAKSLSSNGFTVLAIDLYSHVPDADTSSIESARKSIVKVSDRQMVGDVVGAADYLRALPNASGKIGIIGFCAGGRYTYMSIAYASPADAAVACYGPVMDAAGSVVGANDMRPLSAFKLVPLFSAPLLMINGELDEGPSPEHVEKFKAELERHGKPYKQRFFPGVGHAFLNNPAGERYKPEVAKAAWEEEIVPWFRQHLGVKVATPA